MNHGKEPHKKEDSKIMYKKFAMMIALSFIAMYILMYAMVDTFSNVIPNVNQVYMAGLMTMPMVIIELVVMGGMYMKKKLNAAIITIGFIGLIVFYFCIRQQAAVNDKEFLKSMIPHHGAAILMVEKTALNDPEKKNWQRILLQHNGQRLNR